MPDSLRTIESNDASRAGQYAHGSHILPAERVLHTRNEGPGECGLEDRAAGVGKRVLRVEGGVVVGHGGRNGRRCRR